MYKENKFTYRHFANEQSDNKFSNKSKHFSFDTFYQRNRFVLLSSKSLWEKYNHKNISFLDYSKVTLDNIPKSIIDKEVVPIFVLFTVSDLLHG